MSRLRSFWLAYGGPFVLVTSAAILIGGVSLALQDHAAQPWRDTMATAPPSTGASNHTRAPQRITIEQLKAYLQAGTAIIVDARPPERFHKAHLPGAINVPASEPTVPLPQPLIDYKNRLPVVVYCESATCSDAEWVADRLTRNGYHRVLIFAGGWQAWRKHTSNEES